MTVDVQDQRPEKLSRALNPIMRVLLRSPVGRLVGRFGLLEFQGRRTGRRYLVPVGLHGAPGDLVVFTPAKWSNNFAGGGPATLHHRGTSCAVRGVLVDNPSTVAERLRRQFEAGTKPRDVGLKVRPGHMITATDVAAVHRSMIRIEATND